uniref:lysine-specific demethylase 5D-like isoform X2 n=1 Tax=Myxine glutinosa TaxID=7769 RepID=UPI00358F3A27
MGTFKEFTSPPECPVFQPTREEFADNPLAYIAKIRPIGEKTGIVKIRPPPEWRPPFAVDVDNFRFTPRIQRLNELEAQTRVKLNFLDQTAKFWELQGSTLKIPVVERKLLDLYSLSKLVAEEGGFEVVCKERHWSRVAALMGYGSGRAVGTLLRSHYERVLYPYDLFQSGVSLSSISKPPDIFGEKDCEYKPHGIPLRQSVQPSPVSCGRRAKRLKSEPEPFDADVNKNSELRKLQIFGAGPKMKGLGLLTRRDKETRDAPMRYRTMKIEPVEGSRTSLEQRATTKADRNSKMEMRQRKGALSAQFIDLYECLMCGRGDDEAKLLLCDGCDESYHTFCLIPPLQDVPKGDWRCPKCVAEECRKPQEAFGFEQAKRVYTLQSFGEMADTFKASYFNMPVHMVPTKLVEKEFWRLASSIEEDVSVEYGADVQAKEFGSGFPVLNDKLTLEEKEYARSDWNLNNMPVLTQSVLGHIDGDISGMKVPWLYVGMCFSSFCWHIEDHWSYSINFLHWGEPKTWYGVPAYAAEQLEAVMKKLAPELFEAQPDLLHQLVTIMNPNLLMAHGVPVVRTDQCAGEFVVTFPRAYHSGFNQGFNFAEAVNFCTADWLPMGRSCVDHYRVMRRYCVFSHEEMLCHMALDPKSMELPMAAGIARELEFAITEETTLRRALRDKGITESERFHFDKLADDERQCTVCRTTLFLSAVVCPCCPEHKTCMYHADDLCLCPPQKHILRYSYTVEELEPLLENLKVKAKDFDVWAEQVRDALQPGKLVKTGLHRLQSLVAESAKHGFPSSHLLQDLSQAIREAEEVGCLAAEILNRQHNLEKCNSLQKDSLLTLEELEAFVKRSEQLPCIVSNTKPLQELLGEASAFAAEVRREDQEANNLPWVLRRGRCFAALHMPQLNDLELRLQRACWRADVASTMRAAAPEGRIPLVELRRVIDGGVAHGTESVDLILSRLQEILQAAEKLEEQALSAMNPSKHQLDGTGLRALLLRAAVMPVEIPRVRALQQALRAVNEWTRHLEKLQTSEYSLPLLELEQLFSRGKALTLRPELLGQLEHCVHSAQAWSHRAGRCFIRKGSSCSLLQVLCPKDFSSGDVKTRDVEHAFEHLTATEIVEWYLKASAHELSSLRQLQSCQTVNVLKSKDCCICGDANDGCSSCLQCLRSCHVLCAARLRYQRGGKLLCSLCAVSRRPSLKVVLNLLSGLRDVSVRLAEGEALQSLAERAMAWQDRVQNVLASSEISNTLAELLRTCRRGIAGTRSSTRKCNRAFAGVSKLAKSPSGLAGKALSAAESLHHESDTSVFRKLGSQLILLSDSSCMELHELLLEGNLLEVSMDETQLMWGLLQASRPNFEVSIQATTQHINGLENCLKRKREMGDSEEEEGGASANATAQGCGKQQENITPGVSKRVHYAVNTEDILKDDCGEQLTSAIEDQRKDMLTASFRGSSSVLRASENSGS